jgi:L,D-peptidoglycan transpeptidase YkuD (ErfK/YbiS/YcfS/YnhG family)
VGRTRGRRLGAVLGTTALLIAGCSGSGAPKPRHDPAAATRATSSGPPSSTALSTPGALPSTPHPSTPHPSTPHPSTPHPSTPKAARAPARPKATPKAAGLPLHFATGRATQVITVVAASTSSTQASLQAWRKTDGAWHKVGGPVHAWLGSDGLSPQPSESRSATPIGSFTLTQAFGRDADPGTSLPYTHTVPTDWWISQPGSLYNTRQRCASDCGFTRGAPNEHLYYETPFYNYAVVIDYNTRNAPGGVTQGAGSAFFLHVTVWAPTQGCISIPQDQLIRLLRWLRPSQHPRILIGTG